MTAIDRQKSKKEVCSIETKTARLRERTIEWANRSGIRKLTQERNRKKLCFGIGPDGSPGLDREDHASGIVLLCLPRSIV